MPPLLYNEAYTGPTRAFRVFATPILQFAVGLVLATTAAVAGLIHFLRPGSAVDAAAAFGAIVAPTDGVAFMPIAERLAIPRRVVAIVQGESLAYIPAQYLGISGVLATVTSALYAARFMPPSLDPSARVLSRGMWPVLIFDAQHDDLHLRRSAVARRDREPARHREDHARPLGRVDQRTRHRHPHRLGARHIVFARPGSLAAIGTSPNGATTRSRRGPVSAAEARSRRARDPASRAARRPFPHRSLLIFLTFAVIVATLVGQGATLPFVQTRLGVVPDDERSDESEREAAMTEATRYSLRRLERRVRDGRTEQRETRALRERYERHVLDDDESGEVRDFHRAELRLLADQHLTLVGMRDRGTSRTPHSGISKRTSISSVCRSKRK